MTNREWCRKRGIDPSSIRILKIIPSDGHYAVFIEKARSMQPLEGFSHIPGETETAALRRWLNMDC